MTTDAERMQAELPILREFVDFVNKQVGVYSDCLNGFEGNKVRVERQVARVLRPSGRQIQNGVPVIMYTSVEDPNSPEVIHHRTIRTDEFIAANSEKGFNEQQVCWSIIVFVFAYWDEEIRPKIANVRGVKTDDVTVDAFGDLRLLRRSIVHRKGIISAADHAKLQKMRELVRPDEPITLSHDQMHKVFVLIKQAIGDIIMSYTSRLPGAPDPSTIVDIAI